MTSARRRIATPSALGAAVLLLTLALAGCETGAGTTSDAPASSGSDTSTDTDSSTGSDDASDDASAGYITLSGTGTYTIPDQMPFGGYQLQGEPDSQPAGCTWSIQDASGGHTFENQGSYVFITDIPEAVTFVTEGCPDWEQFE